jgi:phosphonoacetaldehyde hydrolase
MTTIRLVVFDWAGTTVDHGCFAPVAAFVQAFAQQGVLVTTDQARAPMGLHKRDHIQAMLRMPEVARRWHAVHGRESSDQDLERLYQHFIPLQLEVIAGHSRLVPGLLDCVSELRAREIAIGATTGYFRQAAERVYAEARAQGYVPDHCLCAEDVPQGRPAPWMIYRIMEARGVYPPSQVVKVGDTVPDIEEGRNAGVWSIGVTRTSNEVGCSEEEFAALSPTVRRTKLADAQKKLENAGAHVVIESLAELPALVQSLEARLERGDRP